MIPRSVRLKAPGQRCDRFRTSRERPPVRCTCVWSAHRQIGLMAGCCGSHTTDHRSRGEPNLFAIARPVPIGCSGDEAPGCHRHETATSGAARRASRKRSSEHVSVDGSQVSRIPAPTGPGLRCVNAQTVVRLRRSRCAARCPHSHGWPGCRSAHDQATGRGRSS